MRDRREVPDPVSWPRYEADNGEFPTTDTEGFWATVELTRGPNAAAALDDGVDSFDHRAPNACPERPPLASTQTEVSFMASRMYARVAASRAAAACATRSCILPPRAMR